MQLHLADHLRGHDARTTTADRRDAAYRQSTNLVVIRYVVVLNLGPAHRAELIDESNSGIAVQMRDLNPGADVGRAIDVVYRGQRQGAKILHITANERGFLVGLQWDKRYAE